MTARNGEIPDMSRQRQLALAQWDYEGGAGPDGPQEGSTTGGCTDDARSITNTELVQLRVRVIALENLVITLLMGASEPQLALAREMAAYILPRAGAKHHPLTIHAAAQMVNLVERADHFRATTPTAVP